MEDDFYSGWNNIVIQLNKEILKIPGRKKIIVVECYQGIDDEEVLGALSGGILPDVTLLSLDAFLPEAEIRKMTQPDVTDDRIFGHLTHLNIEDFLDHGKMGAMRAEIHKVEEGIFLLYGAGASVIIPDPDLMIYADMARWEIQLRMRRNEVSNLGITNFDQHIEGKYKRGYFIDWRVCDRLKRKVLPGCDWILDTNRKNQPGMISSDAFAEGMKEAVSRPFSVVPYFDEGPWGGQWMKETFNLPGDSANYAWCFNCVPEENSLYLDYGGNRFETPAINLVFFRPEELLGGYVRDRFGDEFPIRFDFLDTMEGGNLSLQVHPLTDYIKEQFGIHYTQDESYYLVEAGEGARVYLGLKEGIDPGLMIRELRVSENSDSWFDDTAYIQNWPARKHDHFLIPAGTVHCSGKECMVLEISATPYIFTFKLWDWGRLGMDGKPRPINIDHGIRNIQWNRTENWVRQNLVNRIEQLSEGEGWCEEKTGLHESEFIETRRHRFTTKVFHNTSRGVNVITLVEGREVIVESPSGSFAPFVVHYAETFIVPAAVGEYSISPCGESEGRECITIKAFVRNELLNY
ncbi:MAG: class I mannose-6-phosphate isomerase [Bacteroidota bacterium]